MSDAQWKKLKIHWMISLTVWNLKFFYRWRRGAENSFKRQRNFNVSNFWEKEKIQTIFKNSFNWEQWENLAFFQTEFCISRNDRIQTELFSSFSREKFLTLGRVSENCISCNKENWENLAGFPERIGRILYFMYWRESRETRKFCGFLKSELLRSRFSDFFENWQNFPLKNIKITFKNIL